MEKKRSAMLLGSICLVLMLAVLSFAGACAKPAAPAPAAPTLAATQKIELRMCHPWVEGHLRAKEGDEWWARQVQERTQGRVTFKIYRSSELFAMDKAYDGIQKGLADVGSVVHSFVVGQMPLWAGIDMPFAFGGDLTKSVGAMREIEEVIGQQRYGIVTLFPRSPPPYHFFMKTRPLKTLADVTGMNIRGLGGVVDKGLAVVGINNVVISTAEVPTALQTGIVDGVITYFGSAKTYRDQIKYVTLVGYVMTSGQMAMNLDTWNKLPKDIQEIMLAVGKETADRLCPILTDDEEKIRTEFEKAGIQVNQLPAADRAKWYELCLPLLDQWAAQHGAEGKKIADIIKKWSQP